MLRVRPRLFGLVQPESVLPFPTILPLLQPRKPQTPVRALPTTLTLPPPQVVLRWGVQTGASVIPKSVKQQRLIENLDIFGFSLDDEDICNLSALDKGRRFNDPGEFTQGMNSFCPIYD